MNTVLEINNLYFKYTSTNLSDINSVENILANFNMMIYKNEILGLAGANGSGKSTLLKLIRGILIPYKGKILLEKKIISQDGINYMLPRIKYITQNPTNTLYPTLTVYENYMISISKFSELSFYSSREHKKKCYKLISKPNMGLEEYMNIQIRFLSGGQQQVLAVLLGLNNSENSIILFDEPTAALDGNIKKRILSLVRHEAKNQKSSVILISHDISDLIEYCDRVVVLKSGKIKEEYLLTQLVNKEIIEQNILSDIL